MEQLYALSDGTGMIVDCDYGREGLEDWTTSPDIQDAMMFTAEEVELYAWGGMFTPIRA